MKSFPVILPLLLGLFALLGSGCVSYEDDAQPAERRASATLLTLVDESRQLTPEQLAERRQNVVSYLIAEGYIYSGEDLVQSASYADQIIRAKLAPDGSFELTIYRPERLAHHEVAFDPAGYPVYTYFPGDIGYFGNGFDPYYLPIAPYYGPRHPYYRNGPRRDHDGPRPDRPRPPGQRPDWNQGNRPPTDRDNGHHDGHQGTPQPGGNSHRDRDQHPGRPNRPTTPQQPGQPPHDPVPPSPGTPVPPPPSAQPNPRPSGPDRQPWVRHPAQPPAAGTAVPVPTASPAQPQPPKPPQGQIDHRRFRPELQPGQPPATPSRPAPASPPPPHQSRSRPEGSPPGTTPPPARTPPPPKPAPEPAKEQSTKSDTPTPSEINTNGRPRENRR